MVEVAFRPAKDALAEATLLVDSQVDTPTCLITDVSDVAMGAILQQCINCVWSQLAYSSSRLTSTEVRYSTFNLELLAVYLAFEHCCHYVLCGHQPQATYVCTCPPVYVENVPHFVFLFGNVAHKH